MTNQTNDLDPVDTPDGDVPLSLAEYRDILDEIDNQPRTWRRTADREMDYADGNQLDTELIRAMKAQGIPTTMENLIGASLEGIRGYEEATRTDWRITSNGQPGGQDVADAISFKLNEAERKSKADAACSGAFYPQIAVGIGWAEVCRNSDPFDYPYQCNVIHRNEIHWDWTSSKDDLSDARWLRRQRWMHPSRLARVFPDHKDLIRRYGRAGINWWSEFDETQYGGGSTGLNRAWDIAREWTRLEDRWFNPMNREVCASELWYRRWSDVIVLKSPDGRVVEFDENNPAHVFAVANRRVQFVRATVAKVRRSYWLGPHVLFDGPSPYAHRYFPYVADRLKHDDGAVLRGFQRLDHAVEIDRAVGAVPIGIGGRLEARALEQAVMVLPGRVADEDAPAGAVLGKEIGGDADRSRAADGLDRRDALLGKRRMHGAEDELLHALAIERMPFHREIGPLCEAVPLIGGLDRSQHRNAAVLVRVDADAEIDLLRSRVGLEAVVERQDRVSSEGFDLSEQ